MDSEYMNKIDRLPRRIGAARTLAGLLLAAAIFPAVADDGKPRFVSGTGRDQGDCLNRFRPCRSLSYAISKAGKGDSIQVAEGQYSIQDSRQLFDVLSVNGRISAGFSKVSGYSERNAAESTVLTGVPPEFRERFEAAGFTVIVDSKGLGVSREESQRMRKLTAQVAASEQSHALAPCVANQSAGFGCQSVSLLSHVSLPQLSPQSARAADVWGFVDLNTGREYALIGVLNGVAIVDVTDPETPEQVGSASGTSTTWHEMKVYQRYDASAGRWRAYAYVTADQVSDFPIVLDLSNLPNGVTRVNYSGDFRAAHNVQLVDTDPTFGIAQSTGTPLLAIAGAGVNGGNYRLYSLANPTAPQLHVVSSSGYAHDLASLPVKDARKNTQCVNAAALAQCQVLADFNENTFDLWDVTNPSAPQLLSSQPYANARYVHSGWWTENGQYLFVHDELDESNFGLNTTVRVFDVSNLRAPTLAASWIGPTRAIDHNGYVRGNRYYFSNYSEGLTVLDVTDPRAPARVGYFDTYPASAETGFVGAWGVYPFLESGTIVIGDINSGLYLLRNETLATPRGSFAMSSPALSGTEGQTLNLSVARSGGATGAVSVQLDLLYATASATDATLASTTLSWADGEAQPKSATLTLGTDTQAENLELLLVRLRNPQGGATIMYPDTTRVTIGDPGSTATLRALEAAPVVEESRAKALITMMRQGSASGEARVSYRTLSGGTYGGATATQGELVWADGDASSKLVTVALNPATLSGGQSGTFQVEFFGALNASLQNASGTDVTSLPLTVTVNDSASAPPGNAPPPSTSPPRNSGGGGSIGWAWLFAIALLFVGRRRSTAR
jgi:choice-of-anchor B domain-containing protein